MRVKCLAQEHNEVHRPRLESRLLDPESSSLTIRPPRHLPTEEGLREIFAKGQNRDSCCCTLGTEVSIQCTSNTFRSALTMLCATQQRAFI